jgi:hypothetical protein
MNQQQQQQQQKPQQTSWNEYAIIVRLQEQNDVENNEVEEAITFL